MLKEEEIQKIIVSRLNQIADELNNHITRENYARLVTYLNKVEIRIREQAGLL